MRNRHDRFCQQGTNRCVRLLTCLSLNHSQGAKQSQDFVDCFAASCKHADDKIKSKMVALVVTDNPEIGRKLLHDPVLSPVNSAVSVHGAVGHIGGTWLRGQPGLDRASLHEQAMLKTFAEFFLMGQSEAAFITANSLFGKIATERGRAMNERGRRYTINDSNCSAPGHQSCSGDIERYKWITCIFFS